MNDTIKDKIGLREFIAIILLTVASKLIDSTPVHFYTVLGNAAWMGPIISALVASILIYLLYKVIINYEEKNLIDVIEILFGKYIGWFILFVLWVNLSLIIIIETAVNTDVITTMYYPNTPALFIYFPLLFVISFAAIKGLQAIGSTAWLFLFVLKFALFVSLFIALGSGEFSFMFPLFGYGEWPVIKYGVKNTAMFSDFLYFFMLITMLKKRKEFKKGITVGFGIIIFDIVFAMITFLMLFDYEAITDLSYPYQELIRYISLGFITNVEVLFFPFLTLAMLIRFSIYLYLNVQLFGKLFNVSKPEMVAPILATITGFLGLIPVNAAFTFPHYRNALAGYFSVVFISLSIVMFILYKIKGGKQHAKQHS